MNFYEWFFLEKDRPAAGLFSWSHLLTVTIILGGLLVLAFFLAKRFKDDTKRSENLLNRVHNEKFIGLWTQIDLIYDKILYDSSLVPPDDDGEDDDDNGGKGTTIFLAIALPAVIIVVLILLFVLIRAKKNSTIDLQEPKAPIIRETTRSTQNE